MREVLRNQDKMFILLEDDGNYVLSTMTGGLGMYEVKVQLTSEEIERYHDEGEEYIALLAYEIGREPGKYKDRIVAR